MLSVCIPVYNVNVAKLVNDLAEQIAILGVPAEIIVIDDCSGAVYTDVNKKALADKCTYIALPQNVGRARIRNMFLKYAQYSHLLFLDCDSGILDKKFLANYIDEIKKGSKVICGGRVYADEKPERAKLLHWTYGRLKESKSASIRQQNPNASFMTNNFVVEKQLFESIKLDENIKGYGHEDTLFGYELKLKGISIKHINIPVLHVDLDINKVFIEHTESAIKNLANIVKEVGEKKDFIDDIALLRTYYKLKRSGLLFLLRISFAVKGRIIRAMLCSGIASMLFLNYYKLGYYTRTANK